MKQSEKEGKEGEKEPTSVDEMSDVTQDARSSDDSAHPRLVSTARRTVLRGSSGDQNVPEASIVHGCLVWSFRCASSFLSRLTLSVGRGGGARRSDGAAPIDHQDLLVKAGRHVGDCRDVVWRVRPRTRGALGAPSWWRSPPSRRPVHGTPPRDERTATGRPSRTSSSVAHHRVPYPPDPVPL